MSAATLNLVCDDALEQGVPYTLQLNLDDGATPTPDPLDLSAWTNFKFTLTQASGGSFQVPWTVTIPTPTNGQIIASLTGDQISAIPATPPGGEKLRLDGFGTNPSGAIVHLITGHVQVKPNPTN